VIEQVVSRVKASSPEQQFIRDKWDAQAKLHKEWVDARKLENVEPGTKVDVRDTEYIWCEGTVKIKVECPNRDPLLVVHYEGWNKYYDEIIKQTSPRLAPHGTYTKRKDLPRYLLKSDNSMVGVIVNRVAPKEVSKPLPSEQKPNQQEEQQQKTPQELKREANAAIGDQVEAKLEEFFRTCEERQHQHSNRGAQPSSATAHPPVVYVRNQLGHLSEIFGGQNIYDALLTGHYQDNNQAPNTFVIRRNVPAN